MSGIKAEAIRIIEHHDGTVNQFVGDEIMALFGIPNAHEDDPIRAVKAALELHEVVRGMSHDVEWMIGQPLTMHSGIDSGLIVTSTWDSRDGKYGVTGDTVNTGARLRARAGGNEILVSSRTQVLISPYFTTESLDPVRLKGKANSIISYRIVGKTAIQTRLEAAKQRGFTPFTGRDTELLTLQESLGDAVRGEGRFVTVRGEAGLGKSRLIHEFCDRLDRHEINVIQGRCQSFGGSTPYLPFLDALRRELKLSDEDSLEELHEKVATNLLMIDPGLEPLIPVYLHLLSIPSDQYPLPAGLTGQYLKEEIQNAIVTITTAVSRNSSTVLVLEDWHWADEASNETLLKIIELIPYNSLMVVVLFRPEYSPRWDALDFRRRINLVSVDVKSVELMIKSIYGVAHFPENFVSQVHQHSGGNPFFVEELCDLLLKEQTVLIEDGKFSLQQPIERIKFPESVQAVIRAKLDILNTESKEVIRLASVIGREFLQRLLEQITARKNDLTASLDDLERSDLIRKIEPVSDKIYQFYHAITQEVTYQTLLIKKRTLLHRLVAETIEILYKERLEEQYEVLAHHYRKGKELEKALHYLELAGDKAARNFSLMDARTYYKEVMELIDSNVGVGQKNADRLKKKRVEISLKWAQASHYAAPDDFYSVLKTSLEYARDLNDEPQIAHLNYWFGQRQIILGKLDSAIEHFSQCVELAERWNERALLAQAYAATGRVYFFEADYSKAIDCLEKSIPILIEVDKQDDVAYSAGFLCGAYSLTGSFEKGLSYGDLAVKTSSEIGNLSREANSYAWTGVGHLARGNWEKSIEACIESIRIAHPVGDLVPLVNAFVWLGHSLFMTGLRTEGLLKIQEGIQIMESSSLRILFPLHYSYLAYGYATAEMTEEALEAANKSVHSIENGMKGFEGMNFFAFAIAESQKPSPDSRQVDRNFEDGINICRKRGQRPFMAQGLYDYARILSERGDTEKAGECLDKANELFSEMKMSWWLEKVLELKVTLS